jgi:hypothetical protein
LQRQRPYPSWWASSEEAHLGWHGGVVAVVVGGGGRGGGVVVGVVVDALFVEGDFLVY